MEENNLKDPIISNIQNHLEAARNKCEELQELKEFQSKIEKLLNEFAYEVSIKIHMKERT